MAIRKSELYSSLWASCDELRGGMDASQYKDYVLAMLFIKYVSDKSGTKSLNIDVPPGASFTDMCRLKGKDTIGDDINKKIIAPLWKEFGLMSPPDFNDPEKLGKGRDMVDRLTKIIAIFERKELDFSRNKAEGDDLLGDAYEYLMRHFATESGKSKGQFYTPSEVSRVLAQILEIDKAATSAETSVYDPTCGSGSLLLKVADQASTEVSLFGQEKDASTTGLAKMNMILHAYDTADIQNGNTLSDPVFKKDTGKVETWDYVVANPPFSDKSWSTGFDPDRDVHARFAGFGVPPEKNGDYAYLLHIVRSIKPAGRGACILPHGVLFRGNAEAVIRRNLIEKRLIKGIIGLPANLFYGTGIPACIVMIDKSGTGDRKGIMMVDAGKEFMKDGNKNRLRERDIHRMVDAFTRQLEIPGYSRMVGFAEIEKNDCNLNIPRYIDSGTREDAQDIEAHLLGDIPAGDIDALSPYWQVMTRLRDELVVPAGRGGSYYSLKVPGDEIRRIIAGHKDFQRFSREVHAAFDEWKQSVVPGLRGLEPGFRPKELIRTIAETLLARFRQVPLLDEYEVYQHLMSYWAETMQDDAYILAADGWSAKTYRIVEKNKQGKETDRGWSCDLVPKELIVSRYFPEKRDTLKNLEGELETRQSRRGEIEEEQSGDEGFFADWEKVNKGAAAARLKQIKVSSNDAEERTVLEEYLSLLEEEASLKKELKEAEAELDRQAYGTYPGLSVDEIKNLVVEEKWMKTLSGRIEESLEQISQSLSRRLTELSERYGTPLPELERRTDELSTTVEGHLKRMGFVW
jgi:type I restriction enzyme M protein